MKLIKLSLATALVATMAFAEETKSDLEISANAAMTSNYIWRGVSQTSNSPAIQGGFDLGYKGAYLGVWGSNVELGGPESMELDIYAGYAGEVSKLSYDIGFIQYAYPTNTEASNFGEAYLGLGYDFDVLAISATYSLGVKTNTIDATDNLELGVSVPLPSDISLDVTYGDYDEVGTYILAGVSKSFGKFDLSVAYSDFSSDAGSASDEDDIVVTIGTSF